MARTIHECDFGGDHVAEDNALAPVVVTLTAFKSGDSSYFDPSELPAWLKLIVAMPNPRVELCTAHADDGLLMHPVMVQTLLANEVGSGRMRQEVADKINERHLIQFRERINALHAEFGGED